MFGRKIAVGIKGTIKKIRNRIVFTFVPFKIYVKNFLMCEKFDKITNILANKMKNKFVKT